MKDTLTKWLYTLEKSLDPNTIKLYQNKLLELNGIVEELKMNLDECRFCFLEKFTRSKKHSRRILIRIILVSNVIYRYFIVLKRSKNKVLLQEISSYYHQILNLLEEFLKDCETYDQTILSELPLTTYSSLNLRLNLRKQLEAIRRKIIDNNIDGELSEIVITGVQALISRAEIKKANVDYAFLILDRLVKLTPFTTIEIENFLFQFEFNVPTFFRYFVRGCTNQVSDVSSLHMQLDVLLGMEDKMNGLPSQTYLKWMPEDESIQNQVRSFISEKKNFVQQRLELRRAEIQDRKLIEGIEKILINLPVAQFGLFIRLGMEKGIVPKDEVGKIFASYAKHFRTPNAPFISAESLQKKSTDVEFSTARKMKSHLIGMVNWLNENYKVQNHNDL